MKNRTSQKRDNLGSPYSNYTFGNFLLYAYAYARFIENSTFIRNLKLKYHSINTSIWARSGEWFGVSSSLQWSQASRKKLTQSSHRINNFVLKPKMKHFGKLVEKRKHSFHICHAIRINIDCNYHSMKIQSAYKVCSNSLNEFIIWKHFTLKGSHNQ